jgi:putative ABC transport system permease protein
MSPWSFALRNVTRNLRRSVLTGCVVTFGFCAFALAGGFMAQSLEGLRDGTIRGGIGHLQFAAVAAFDDGAAAAPGAGLAGGREIAAILASDPAVAEVLPRIEFAGLVTTGERSVPFLGTGLDPGPEARAMDAPRLVVEGAWLGGRSDRAVILGTGLAAALTVRVGGVVTLMTTTPDGTLNAVDATVAGLARIPFRELNDRYLATSLDLAAELLSNRDGASKIVVVLTDGARAPAALSRLLGTLEARGHPIAGRTWLQLAPFYRQVRTLYLGIFGFMGALLVIMVLLAAANTMMMAVGERVREIGTLRAIGTRARFIRRMFVAEGLVLGIGGCLAGALLSLVVRFALNHSGIELPPPPGGVQGSILHVKFYGAAYGAGALAMIATLAAASWLPARRAARRRIVEALAHV